MDSQRFDNLTKGLGSEGTRRNALRTMAVLGAGLVGARAFGAATQAAAVDPQGSKCAGMNCANTKECGKGLGCNWWGVCEYKSGNGLGKKGDTCCGNFDCSGKLRCKDKTCTKK